MAENLTFKGIRKFELRNPGMVRIGVLRGSANGEAVPFLGIHPLVDSFNAANKSSVRLIRPQVADAVLAAHPDNWKFFAGHGCSIFPTSVVVAYRAHGEKLGSEDIVFTGRGGRQMRFPTGIRQTGVKAKIVALGMEVKTGDFEHEGTVTTMRASTFRFALNLPIVSGSYSFLPFALLGFGGIPGKVGAPDSRYIMKEDSGIDFVAPLVRETGRDGERIRAVSLDCSPFEKYGVVVEIPEGDLKKFA